MKIHNWNLSVRWDNTAPNVCGLATLLLLSSRNFSEYDYAFSKCFLQQKLQLQSKNVVHAVIRSGGRKQYRDVVSSSYLLLLWRNPKYGGDDGSSFIIHEKIALLCSSQEWVYSVCIRSRSIMMHQRQRQSATAIVKMRTWYLSFVPLISARAPKEFFLSR